MNKIYVISLIMLSIFHYYIYTYIYVLTFWNIYIFKFDKILQYETVPFMFGINIVNVKLLYLFSLKWNFRFQIRKLLINSKTELKSSYIGSFAKRHITQIAMIDEEKDFEVEIMQSELHTLSWLHKVAPCFPVHGSKVEINNFLFKKSTEYCNDSLFFRLR